MNEETFPNERLRRARCLKGWSQEELAEKIGTSATMVSRWERGVNAPSPYFRERLCAALDGTAEELGLVRPLQPLEDEQSPISLKPLTPSPVQRKRRRLLQRVQSLWIKGVLDHSLHGAALITLGLQEQPEAIVHPWGSVFSQPETTPRLLLTGMRITEVYDAADEELLILGASGAGKTTLLLELTRDLLSRAQQDESHPFPFVFNLSSWSTEWQGLAEWLVEELHTKYRVPHKLGRTLVEKDEILPLLDGLDEVDTKDRTACIEAINTYREEHGLFPLVVCCRSTDYLAQTARLQLGYAVEIQPLTDQQIDDYLTSAGEPLEALRIALRQDDSLREITSTPLMLSILTLTYHGSSVEDLSRASSPTDRQQRVFEHYIEHVLKRRGTATSYLPQHTIEWLAWLAQQMRRHGQTIFYIERMQPEWLPESWPHRLYYSIIVRLGIGMVSGLILYLTLGVAIGLFIGTSRGLGTGFVSGLIGGLVCGLTGGLVMALTSRIEREIRPAEVVVWSWRRLVQVSYFKRTLVVGTSSGLAFGLLMGMALAAGGNALKALLIVPAVILVVVTIIMLAGGLTSGVSTTLQNERDLTLPNQGIRQSVRNSTRIGIMSGFVGGSISIGAFFLIITLIGMKFLDGPVSELGFLLLCGTMCGTISGLIVGLPNGGIASIQHLVLRILLWRSRLIPWNYPHFLDHATEHILLSKVGGGYMFIHRLLLEHFVSREGVFPH
jgi:transcriptional regulator with XRE-family HTH domain